MFGAPLPMVVLQATSDGFDVLRAASMAAATAARSWPSTDRTSQPAARKRATWFIEVERDVGPSIEIRLSSQRTISR